MKTTIIHKSRDKCSFVSVVDNPTKSKVATKRTHRDASKLIEFDDTVYLIGRSSIVGKKEGDGPLGKLFDEIVKDDKCGQKNFEQAEIYLLVQSVQRAIVSSGISKDNIDALIAGDLLNQLTVSNYAARDLGIPFLGMYSACSTMTQALIVGAALVSAGHISNVACAVSSHFASAERQFRYPLEYGAQKPPYAQWTVTGSACMILGRDTHIDRTKDNDEAKRVKITKALIGRVVDFGVTDMSNMGAAMAPAFVDTLLRFFAETGTSASDYDLIVSGDLGKLGSDIAIKLAGEKGVVLQKQYMDCGATMYSRDQHVYQGGSGPACSATVVNAFVIKKLVSGECKNALYLATGALMSPQCCFQGETIPCISHAVLFET